MLCVHYAIRALMLRAAEEGGVDPDRLSFTSTARAAKLSVRRALDASSTNALAIGEVLHHLLPRRRLRSNPRVVRRKMSNYGVKRPEHRHWPQPTLPVEQAVCVLGA
jgi:hypothetical protein